MYDMTKMTKISFGKFGKLYHRNGHDGYVNPSIQIIILNPYSWTIHDHGHNYKTIKLVNYE